MEYRHPNAALSFTPLTTIVIEPRVAATSPAVNNVLAEFHAFEYEIWGLIEPEGIHSPQSKGTIVLVTDKMNKNAEVVEDLGRNLDEKKEWFE